MEKNIIDLQKQVIKNLEYMIEVQKNIIEDKEKIIQLQKKVIDLSDKLTKETLKSSIIATLR